MGLLCFDWSPLVWYINDSVFVQKEIFLRSFSRREITTSEKEIFKKWETGLKKQTNKRENKGEN